jgi:hypothetical protein
MSQAYALPDLETFYVSPNASASCPVCDSAEDSSFYTGSPVTVAQHKEHHIGWYWWSCFPGCLPDGEPMGPFESEAEALEDARDYIGDDEDGNA